MCGIAGIVSDRAEDLSPIEAMCSALRHRGPDDEGYLVASVAVGKCRAYAGADTVASLALPRLTRSAFDGAQLALGHRRLSILDLSPAGHGPMASADGSAWVTYNGEIYNYLELREELRALGHGFHTATDTEVLLAAWQQWGPACLHRFNGMWAFGLYDVRRRLLFAARDRFGIKPFHYAWDGQVLVFASEIKGLRAHPHVHGRPREATLRAFLAGGFLDEGDATFFEGIRSLPPGHALFLDLATHKARVSRWYELPRHPQRPGSPQELRGLLESAVELHLRSDVDVGSCLSGGLDSSSIVALTARQWSGAVNHRHRAFSVLYSDPGLDESAFVDSVVRASGVEAAVTRPTSAQFVVDLPRLVEHQDEPFSSAAVYSQWRVMRLAHEVGARVLLDGQGADEVLAGYHYQFGPFLAEIAADRGLAAAVKQARAAARITGRPLAFFLGLVAYHTVPIPYDWRARLLVSRATHGRVPAELLGTASGEALPRSTRHRPQRTLADERHAELTAASLPALLRYEDRNSMAFSIEARTPFLDYRLVERALALPATDLLRDGWTKALLREAMKDVLPENVRLRRDKVGFGTPERRWLAEIAPQVREWLGPGSHLRTHLNASALERWLSLDDAALATRPGLFRLVSAELWLRQLNEARRVA